MASGWTRAMATEMGKSECGDREIEKGRNGGMEEKRSGRRKTKTKRSGKKGRRRIKTKWGRNRNRKKK